MPPVAARPALQELLESSAAATDRMTTLAEETLGSVTTLVSKTAETLTALVSKATGSMATLRSNVTGSLATLRGKLREALLGEANTLGDQTAETLALRGDLGGKLASTAEGSKAQSLTGDLANRGLGSLLNGTGSLLDETADLSEQQLFFDFLRLSADITNGDGE